MAKRRGIVGEFFLFLRHHKAYWMAPIILVMLLMVLVVLLTGSAGVLSPFLYPF